MGYQQLFIFLEGPEDERFFEKIKPLIDENYDYVRFIKWATAPSITLGRYVRSLRSTEVSNYFFVTDINNSPCVTHKKGKLKKVKNFRNVLEEERIVVVIKEIESWYLAGLDDSACKELRIETLGNTNNITKEDFNRIIPEKFDSRIDFMQEILKRFSIETAKEKNVSFNYFVSKV
jgi:hypothetical protein